MRRTPPTLQLLIGSQNPLDVFRPALDARPGLARGPGRKISEENVASYSRAISRLRLLDLSTGLRALIRELTIGEV